MFNALKKAGKAVADATVNFAKKRAIKKLTKVALGSSVPASAVYEVYKLATEQEKANNS